MALIHAKVDFKPGANGAGEMCVDDSGQSPIATMQGDGYWAVDYSTLTDRDEQFRITRLRKAMEDFVKNEASEPQNAGAEVGGCRITLIGNNAGAAGRSDDRARLLASGRIHIIH